MLRLKKYLQSHFQVSEKDWTIISEYFGKLTLRKNEYFVHEGKISRYMGFILEGVIRYKRIEEDGEETTCFFSSENEFVGDPDSFFSQKPSLRNEQAVTDMSLAVISLPKFQEFVHLQPHFQKITSDIDIGVCRNLLDQRDFLINKDAETRYRLFMEKFPYLLNRVPLQYVASFLDIAQPSLSRLRRQII